MQVVEICMLRYMSWGGGGLPKGQDLKSVGLNLREPSGGRYWEQDERTQTVVVTPCGETE